MSERVKCLRCDYMILPVTAETNKGLCGRCAMDADREEFQSIVHGWIMDPKTLPGMHGNPMPDDIALMQAAEDIRSQLYPNAEEEKENFCHEFCDEAQSKWEKLGAVVLTDKEKFCLAVETFYGEVSNGGLTQYLSNQSGNFASWAADGFEAIGIPEIAEVARKMCALFPGGVIPENEEERWEAVDALNEEQLEAIEQPFFDRYNEQSYEIRNALYAYLKA